MKFHAVERKSTSRASVLKKVYTIDFSHLSCLDQRQETVVFEGLLTPCLLSGLLLSVHVVVVLHNVFIDSCLFV